MWVFVLSLSELFCVVVSPGFGNLFDKHDLYTFYTAIA